MSRHLFRRLLYRYTPSIAVAAVALLAAAGQPAFARSAPSPGAAPPVDFTELFDRAERFHESVGAARSQAVQSAYERDKVFASMMPEINLDYGINRRRDAKLGIGGSVIRTKESRTASLSVRQPLYTGGRASNQLKIATIAQAAGGIGVHISREALIYDLAQAYFTVLKAEADLDTVTERLTGMRKQAEAANARVRVGADVRASALRIESEVAALEAERVAAENALENARENLALLTGDRTRITLGAPPQLDKIAHLANPVAAALTARADLNLIEGEVQAARYGIKFTQGTFLPFVDLTGTYQQQSQSPSLSFVPDEDASVGLNVTWNLYNGGEDRAERARARAVYTEKQLDYDRLKREITAQVEQALREVQATDRRTAAFSRAMESATENHRIVAETYKAGAATYLDVIDASTNLGDARRNLINARHDHSLALLGLAQATGQLVTLVGEPVPDFTDLKRWLAR